MRRIILLMTVAALVLVSALGGVVVSAGAHKHPTAKANTNKNPTRTVLIQNFRFKPAKITVERGTRVRWINKDSAHRNGEQRKIVRLRTLGARRAVFAHLQERGEEVLPL